MNRDATGGELVRPFITFLTGVSGSGKTAMYQKLREDPDFADVSLHDIDEDGVPPAGRGPWREFRVELLLHRAVRRLHAGGTPTVVCGITFPHEVTWSDYYSDELPVSFVMVDTSPQLIASRLTARVASREFADDDECFSPDNREAVIEANLRLRVRLARSVRSLKAGVVIDTRERTLEQMYSDVKTHLAPEFPDERR